jgi:ABC-2 type transport system ATP-binding protein
MNNPAISVEQLQKVYHRKVALDDVTFHVPRGSVCGFVGPNGAGKTTTIQILMDMAAPSSGHVEVLGLNPTRHGIDLRQRVGYVPEKHTIPGWMRVREVVEFAGGVYPRWNGEEYGRVTKILDVDPNRRVKELSRGEAAKLALILALSHEPDLLLLDEPTSGLDPLVRRDFLEAVTHLLKDRERSVFFSTHILSDVERIADRIVLINEGRIVLNETLEQLRQRFTRSSFLFDSAPPTDLVVPGARRIERGIREIIAVFDSKSDSDMQAITDEIKARNFIIQPMLLDDVFVEIIERRETT